jgi:hypothetical protein
MPQEKFVSLFLFFVAACSPPMTPAAVDSGVQGQAMLGPSCPVVQVDNPCPDEPYAGTLTILAEGSSQVVAQIQADAQGFYRIALAPGHYLLRRESPGIRPFAADVPFLVQAHQFTRLDVVFDTGIR